MTHDQGNETSYQAPVGFDGWAGNSATWPMPFGQARSDVFSSLLGALPAVSTWFAP